MINAIQLKGLELVNRFMDGLKDGEKGQTATEYVAITAVGLLLAILVVWGALSGALSGAISTIGSRLTDFVTNTTSF